MPRPSVPDANLHDPPRCNPWAVLAVVLSFAMSVVMARALVQPSPATIRGLVDTCWILLIVESLTLVPMYMAAGSGVLHGRPRAAFWYGAGFGGLAFLACALFGNAGFGVVLGALIHARVCVLARERRTFNDGFGLVTELLSIVRNRWFVQFLLFLAVGIFMNLAWDITRLLPPEARSILRYAGGGDRHSLVDVVMLLSSGSLYYLLTGLNDLFRLPCLFPSLHWAGEEEENEPDVAAAAHLASATPPLPPMPAEVARQQADAQAQAAAQRSAQAIERALETPDGARHLLFALLPHGDEAQATLRAELEGIPLARRVLLAERALAAQLLLAPEARAATLAQFASKVAADRRVTALEFALSAIVRARLGPVRAPAAPGASLDELGPDCETLLALLQQAGEGDAARSFAHLRALLRLPAGSVPAPPDMPALWSALQRLAALPAPERTHLLRVLADAAHPLNELRGVLLYAYAATLGVPLPAEARPG